MNHEAEERKWSFSFSMIEQCSCRRKYL